MSTTQDSADVKTSTLEKVKPDSSDKNIQKFLSENENETTIPNITNSNKDYDRSPPKIPLKINSSSSKQFNMDLSEKTSEPILNIKTKTKKKMMAPPPQGHSNIVKQKISKNQVSKISEEVKNCEDLVPSIYQNDKISTQKEENSDFLDLNGTKKLTFTIEDGFEDFQEAQPM